MNACIFPAVGSQTVVEEHRGDVLSCSWSPYRSEYGQNEAAIAYLEIPKA